MLLSMKISLFDVFKQLLTLHKLTPTSDATSKDLIFIRDYVYEKSLDFGQFIMPGNKLLL